MRVIKIDSSRCKGCFLCVSVCPSEALAPSGILGPKGYETVVVDDTNALSVVRVIRCVLTTLLKYLMRSITSS